MTKSTRKLLCFIVGVLFLVGVFVFFAIATRGFTNLDGSTWFDDPEPVVYTVTFDANGGELTDSETMQTNASGKLDELPTDPQCPDYSFAFWGTKAGCGIYVPADERKDYDDNDYDFGSRVTVKTVFTKDSTVYAWYYNNHVDNPEDDGDNGDGDGDKDDPDGEIIPAPIVLYTVTFDANGGELTDNETMQTNASGRLDAFPSEPIYDGYTFAGWYTSRTVGTQVTLSTVFTEDTTVFAYWTSDEPIEEVTYTVTFDPNEGLLRDVETMQTNSEQKLDEFPADPVRVDYIFLGWYTSATSDIKITLNSVFSSDTTVYAQWQRIYSVTFNPNGGELTGDTVFPTNAERKLDKLADNPTFDGYLFLGWFTALSMGETVTTDTVFSEDTTVHALWKAIEPYTVTFDACGGTISGAETSTVQLQTNVSGKLSSLPYATDANYKFDGWYTSANVKVEKNTVFYSDTTVYAHWTENVYYVNFDFNGGFYYDDYGNFYNYSLYCSTGAEFRLTSYPSEQYIFRDNYFFLGWYNDPVDGECFDGFQDMSFKSNITVYAHWQYDDTSYGHLGDRASRETLEEYAYFWVPNNVGVYVSLSNLYETKVMFIFDSPYTYSYFDVDPAWNGEKIEFTIDSKHPLSCPFRIDSLSFDYPTNIDFGFGDVSYELLEPYGIYGEFAVDDYFFTSSAYMAVFVHTTLSFCDPEEVDNYLPIRSNLSNSIFYDVISAHYSGLNTVNNAVLLIRCNSDEYVITGAELIFYPNGDVYKTWDYEFCKTQPYGGVFSFPVSWSLDDSGAIANFDLCLTVERADEVNSDFFEHALYDNGIYIVGDQVDGLLLYNDIDGIVSFEYYGDLSESLVFAYSPYISAPSIPILRHYTYASGGSIIFEWDGSSDVYLVIYSLYTIDQYPYDSEDTTIRVYDDTLSTFTSDYYCGYDVEAGIVFFVCSRLIEPPYELMLTCGYGQVSSLVQGRFGFDDDYDIHSGYYYYIFAWDGSPDAYLNVELNA